MKLPALAGCFGDFTQTRLIAEIASVHGGLTPDGDRDTISRLSETEERYGQDVRPRFLAAILRFADELADDRTRTSEVLRNNGMIPEESEIYHAYSYSLPSVIIREREVRLSYEMPRSDAVRTYTKRGTQVYLLDEIYSRTRKMHQERLYCMRFWEYPYATVDRITVRVEIWKDAPGGTPSKPLKKIEFCLQESGYPSDAGHECNLCLTNGPELLAGVVLKSELE